MFMYSPHRVPHRLVPNRPTCLVNSTFVPSLYRPFPRAPCFRTEPFLFATLCAWRVYGVRFFSHAWRRLATQLPAASHSASRRGCPLPAGSVRRLPAGSAWPLRSDCFRSRHTPHAKGRSLPTPSRVLSEDSETALARAADRVTVHIASSGTRQRPMALGDSRAPDATLPPELAPDLKAGCSSGCRLLARLVVEKILVGRECHIPGNGVIGAQSGYNRIADIAGRECRALR